LPLTLLRLNDFHKLSVIELGMNHPGETAQLAAIAAPTIAIINNAQREHQEFMLTVEAVAEEHAAVIPALADKGTVVFPAQDTYVKVWRDSAAKHHKQVIDFALHTATDTTPALVTGSIQTNTAANTNHAAQTIVLKTPLGEATIGLNIAGEHHARNALAAASVAIAAGLPLSSVVAGLQAFEPVKGRMQQHSAMVAGKAICVIDDSYNANPDSVAAAISVLSGVQTGRSVLVLGDMGEVGNQGPQFHAEAGEKAAAQGVAVFYTVGDLMKNGHAAFTQNLKAPQIARHFASAGELQTALIAEGTLQSGDTVLVKGSRFMRMEFVVEALLGKADALHANALHANALHANAPVGAH
jgi:UDP-N-acetylmuramoyl-tripeptide--D-alanyl-D-alanine ligase